MTEPEAAPASPQPASIRRRLASLVYEGILLFGVVFVAGFLFSIATHQRNGLTYHNLMAAWIAIVAGVYFISLWHYGGQTLPMKTWRLRVVGPRGTPPSLGRAMVRYLAAWLWFLPPLALHPLLNLSLPRTLFATAVWFVLWAATAWKSRGRQFPHDRIAGTHVLFVPK